MKIEPTYDNVAVVLDKPETMKGHIALPQTARDDTRYPTGRVIAIGCGRRVESEAEPHLVPPPCKVGDRVLLSYLTDYAISGPDGAEVFVVPSSNILAVIHE